MKKQWSQPPAMAIDVNKSYTAILHTNKGDISIDLFPKESPKTVNNFVFLARNGFYDGVIFHRIIKHFMVQTGDPTGTGGGGPGYSFPDELPPKYSYELGIVAMANSGPNTNGSQFFIVSGPQGSGLDNPAYAKYSQFGKVTTQDSLAVLAKIASTPVGLSSSGEMSAPKEVVRIDTVEIVEH